MINHNHGSTVRGSLPNILYQITSATWGGRFRKYVAASGVSTSSHFIFILLFTAFFLTAPGLAWEKSDFLELINNTYVCNGGLNCETNYLLKNPTSFPFNLSSNLAYFSFSGGINLKSYDIFMNNNRIGNYIYIPANSKNRLSIRGNISAGIVDNVFNLKLGIYGNYSYPEFAEWYNPNFKNRTTAYFTESAGLERFNETVEFDFSQVAGWDRSMIQNDCDDILVVNVTTQQRISFENQTCSATNVKLRFMCSLPANSVSQPCADIYFNNPSYAFSPPPSHIKITSKGGGNEVAGWNIEANSLTSTILQVSGITAHGNPARSMFGLRTGLTFIQDAMSVSFYGLHMYDSDFGTGNGRFQNLTSYSANFGLDWEGTNKIRNMTFFGNGDVLIRDFHNGVTTSDYRNVMFDSSPSYSDYEFWKSSNGYVFQNRRGTGTGWLDGFELMGVYNSTTKEYLAFFLKSNSTPIKFKADGGGLLYAGSNANPTNPQAYYSAKMGKFENNFNISIQNEFLKIKNPLINVYSNIENQTLRIINPLPKNGITDEAYSTSLRPINFNFTVLSNVKINELQSEIMINGTSYSSSNATNNTLKNIDIPLNVGFYSWFVRANDSYNSNSTESRFLNIIIPPTPTPTATPTPTPTSIIVPPLGNMTSINVTFECIGENTLQTVTSEYTNATNLTNSVVRQEPCRNGCKNGRCNRWDGNLGSMALLFGAAVGLWILTKIT